jgi:hypothetical protein
MTKYGILANFDITDRNVDPETFSIFADENVPLMVFSTDSSKSDSIIVGFEYLIN